MQRKTVNNEARWLKCEAATRTSRLHSVVLRDQLHARRKVCGRKINVELSFPELGLGERNGNTSENKVNKSMGVGRLVPREMTAAIIIPGICFDPHRVGEKSTGPKVLQY